MKNLLLSSSVLGFLWLCLLFVFCFFCVHIYKLVQLGLQYRKEKLAQPIEKPTSAPPPQKTKKDEEKLPPQTQREPIYYIVERKRKKKPRFHEAKRIQFKKD